MMPELSAGATDDEAMRRRILLTRRPTAQPALQGMPGPTGAVGAPAQPPIQRQQFSDTREQDFRRVSVPPVRPAAPTLASPPPQPNLTGGSPFAMPMAGLNAGMVAGANQLQQRGIQTPTNLQRSPMTPAETAQYPTTMAGENNRLRRSVGGRDAMADADGIRGRLAEVARGGGTEEAQRTQQVQQANAAMDASPRGQQNARIAGGMDQFKESAAIFQSGGVNSITGKASGKPSSTAYDPRPQDVAAIRNADAAARAEEAGRKDLIRSANMNRAGEQTERRDLDRSRRLLTRAGSQLASMGDTGAAAGLVSQARSMIPPRGGMSAAVGQRTAQEQMGQQRAFELDKAALENPPRGQTSTAKPGLDPATASRVNAFLSRLRAAGLDDDQRAVIQKEMEAMLANTDTSDDLAALRGRYERGGKPAPAATPQPSEAAPPAASKPAGTKEAPAQPATQEEYEALPSGAWFIDGDGEVKQKP